MLWNHFFKQDNRHKNCTTKNNTNSKLNVIQTIAKNMYCRETVMMKCHSSRDVVGHSSSNSLSSRRFWSSAERLGKKLIPVTASMSLRGVRL